MEDKIRVLLTEEEVNEKIKKIGEQVSKDYAGKSKAAYFSPVNWQRESPFRYLSILCP